MASVLDSSRWQVGKPPDDKVLLLQNTCNVSRLCAQVLVSRNMDDPKAVMEFLNTSLNNTWRSPYIIPDMLKGVERIVYAIQNKEEILVFGDFDVDGMSATALLTLGLKELGACVTPFIPHRFDEGYGLSLDAFEHIFETQTPAVIVTVDNGISAYHEVEWLKSKDIDVVVTDHHEPSDLVPQGVPVINPKKDPSCPSKILAGAGVALKLLQALGEKLQDPNLWLKYVDLAMLGTVSDMMVLGGENRALVKAGVVLAQQGKRAGLRALYKHINQKIETLSADTLPFTIIPRLNAAGRMGKTEIALDLLMQDDWAQAQMLSMALDTINAERKEIELALFEEAKKKVGDIYPNTCVLVVANENWHEGVKGIVSAKLSNLYQLPAILFTIQDGVAKGSGRSVGQVDLFWAVSQVSDVLLRFGGHSGAVGVTLLEENLPEFTRRLQEVLETLPYEAFIAKEAVSTLVRLDELSLESVESLEILQPFGQGNARPLFGVCNVELCSKAKVGASQDHVRFCAVDTSGSHNGIMFFASNIDDIVTSCEPADIVFDAVIDSWRDKKSVKLMVKDVLLHDSHDGQDKNQSLKTCWCVDEPVKPKVMSFPICTSETDDKNTQQEHHQSTIQEDLYDFGNDLSLFYPPEQANEMLACNGSEIAGKHHYFEHANLIKDLRAQLNLSYLQTDSYKTHSITLRIKMVRYVSAACKTTFAKLVSNHTMQLAGIECVCEKEALQKSDQVDVQSKQYRVGVVDNTGVVWAEVVEPYDVSVMFAVGQGSRFVVVDSFKRQNQDFVEVVFVGESQSNNEDLSTDFQVLTVVQNDAEDDAIQSSSPSFSEDMSERIRRTLIGEYEYLPAQAQALKLLGDGHSCLCVMATGRGKSAIFQTHAARLALTKKGVSIFVLPLRALVNDQAYHLQNAFSKLGLNIAVITGASLPAQREQVMRELSEGVVSVVLTTPEYLGIHCKEFVQATKVDFLVIDEAHHAATSKDGTRAVYQALPDLRRQLGYPQVLAVSATLNDEQAQEIQRLCDIQKTCIVVDDTARNNLHVVDKRPEKDKLEALQEIVGLGEKTVIYVNSKKLAQYLCKHLRKSFLDRAHRIGFYHAGLCRQERTLVERAFREGYFTCIVATSAFGEGVNIPDIRHVVLYHVPFGAIEFNQMSGRAGRDGSDAFIHVLCSEKDAELNTQILEGAVLSRERLMKLYNVLHKMKDDKTHVISASVEEICLELNKESETEETVESVETGLRIFEELKFVHMSGFGLNQAIVFETNPVHTPLTSSVIYSELLKLREEFDLFEEWLFGVQANEIQAQIVRPITPKLN